MRPDHSPWREHLLAYEDLEPDERRALDAHLATCAACRTLMAALREREQRAAVLGQLSSTPLALSAEDAQAERASLEALVRKLPSQVAGAPGVPGIAREPGVGPAPLTIPAREIGRERRVGRDARGPRSVRAWSWLVPAAAAIVLAIVYTNAPRLSRTPSPRLESLAVERASGLRGEADTTFRTGDAFVLRLRLSLRSIPFVVVIDEAGTPILLHPAGEAAARVYPPGPLVLPDSSLGEAWTFSGASGRETFLAAALPEGAARLDSLRARIQAAASTASDRAARLQAVRLAIEQAAGEVHEVTVHHAERAAPRR